MATEKNKRAMYRMVIEQVFSDKFKTTKKPVDFTRDYVVQVAKKLGVDPKNVGDIIYTYRFRRKFPESITSKAPKGSQWVILGVGDSQYAFTLVKASNLAPRPDLEAVKIPVATPEIVLKYQRSEEQALLAVVRYNRLVDLFLGVTAYSLQNHLRTKVKSIGQMEIDELYVGISKSGAQYVIPVQAKGGKDKQGVSQILQDAEFCRTQFPNLVPRLLAAQFIDSDHVAMLELAVTKRGIKIRKEGHYQLVPADQITDEDLQTYKEADG
jgi:hypothetical protein